MTDLKWFVYWSQDVEERRLSGDKKFNLIRAHSWPDAYEITKHQMRHARGYCAWSVYALEVDGTYYDGKGFQNDVPRDLLNQAQIELKARSI